MDDNKKINENDLEKVDGGIGFKKLKGSLNYRVGVGFSKLSCW